MTRRPAISYQLSAISYCLMVGLVLPVGAGAQATRPVPRIELRPGLVITRSARVVPGNYRLPAPASLDSAAVTVRGDNIVVDLAGVVLQGADPSAEPDQAAGVAIRIEGGRNVRLTGARIRGYQIGILAVGTWGLVLQHIDAGYNWKPRLYSGVEHESLADWLSFHQNEKREWLRYGAGFYLEDVVGGEVRGNQVTQGMNGLLLVRSDSLRIQDNTFSFNSGLGIGLYRSRNNVIVRNRLDYNVRGYSQGFYRRGQDSADLLLYEQSSGNLVAWNSATHGGDGLFLWAGQSTMDTGKGGANDNVFYANDFSFAPANAMEATFSRNSFIANRAAGSDYGLWGGYSFESRVVGNCFLGNRVGIAIEHGQDNSIVGNRFVGDTTAISLWANPIEPSDWGYPKQRDTSSRDYQVQGNEFVGNRVGIRAASTARLALRDNRFTGVDSVAVLRDTAAYRFELNPIEPGPRRASSCVPPQPILSDSLRRSLELLGGPTRVPDSPAARLDRSAIIVDEWGPFDWRSPKLWPIDSTRAVPLRLRTVGPSGTWRVASRVGLAAISRSTGRIGDTITVVPAGGGTDWKLDLEYRGGSTVSPRGERRGAGSRTRFGYERFEPALEWSARFYAWNDSTDVRQDPQAFAALVRATPLLIRRLPRLDFQWYRPLLPELPRERWALEASATVTLPPGSYRIRTISDDGVRVWVDGALVVDRWTVHESTVDSAPLSGGRHGLRVQYFQDGGWTELRVEILRS
ncbi:MAG TPA: NosD domain-containing protein [Gemmatimonadales bacterium]|nr:NosD domain-containing protein [Gemmatimonadales bacterium]